MSLIHTESFVAFKQWTGDDAFNTANTDMRKAFTAAFKRAGYIAQDSGHATYQESGAWIVRPDPIYPDRSALVYSSGNTANANRGTAYAFGAALRKPLVSQGRPVIGGFSLFVPQEYVPNALNVNTVGVLYVVSSTLLDTNNVPAAVNTLFVVQSDLSISNTTNVRQSSKVLVPGRLSYIEYRVVDNEVRVWVDDVLVLQSAISVPPESIGFVVYQQTVVAPNTFMQGAPGRWAISNWYNLIEDAQYPNVRLGSTTRVIGVRAGADVDVDFLRPADATTNAQVASQDIVENPLMSLQSSTVGDMDVYAATKDTATSSGKMIHAVATKVLASNLESAPHSLRALVMSANSVEKEDPRPREFRRLDNGQTVFGTRAMYSAAQRPTDGKIFVSGMGPCVYSTPPNGSVISPFTSVLDEGTTTVWAYIAFRVDGVGIVARSDGKLHVIPPNTDIPPVSFALTTPAQAPRSMIVLPDSTVLIGTSGGKIWRLAPGADATVAANWLLMTTPVTGQIDAIVYSPALKRVVAQVVGTVVITSDDAGVTWVSRTHGLGAAPSAGQIQLAFDGNAFSMVSQNTTSANYVRRSLDGITWTSPGYNTNGSTQGVIQFGFGDNGVIVMLAGNTTAISSFDGGVTWRRLNVFPGAMYGAGVMMNGDWIMLGASGVMVGYTSALIDAPLLPLAGYQATYNVSTTNPDTGAPWTPAEAAAAKFGMRITS